MKDVTSEQLLVGLIPEQATPLFSAKLRVVSLAILEALAEASGVLRYSLLRTRAKLLMAMVSLQRGKQLGGTRTESVMPFQDDRGLPFNYVCGKTLKDGTKHFFQLRGNASPGGSAWRFAIDHPPLGHLLLLLRYTTF